MRSFKILEAVVVAKVLRWMPKNAFGAGTYEEKVCLLVPGVGVDRELQVLVDLVGSVLEEKSG